MRYSVCVAFLMMNVMGMITSFSNFANVNEKKRYSVSKPRNIGINNENPIRNPDYIPEKNETILSNSPLIRNYNPFKPKSIYNERIRMLNSKNQKCSEIIFNYTAAIFIFSVPYKNLF